MTDVVEQGAPLGRPRPRRVAPLVVGGLLILLLAVAVITDHHVRVTESARVSACVEAATSAVRYSSARVDAIVNYVRPSLESDVPGPLRRRLLGLVSVSVVPTVSDVRRARAGCTYVEVLRFHGRLGSIRRDCLRLLDRDLAYLDQVTLDGARAFDVRSLPAGGCTSTPAGT